MLGTSTSIEGEERIKNTFMESSQSLPFPTSLCHQCSALRMVENKRRSIFLMCAVKEEKYLPQPVVICDDYDEKQEPG